MNPLNPTTGSQNPYKVLGIPIESTRDEAKLSYKKWMKYLHPDKGNYKGNESERVEYMELIRDAYKYIINQTDFKEYPTEQVVYSNIEEIEFRKDFVKKKKKPTKNGKVNKKWKQKFEKIQKELKGEDPNQRGYSEFGKCKLDTTQETNEKIQKMEYNPFDILPKGTQDEPDTVFYKTHIEQHQRGVDSIYDLTIRGTTDLGLNEIHDLSINLSENIQGTDLSSAFTNSTISEKDITEFRNKYERTEMSLNDLLHERNSEINNNIIEPLPENTESLKQQKKLDIERQHMQMIMDKRRAKIIMKHIGN